MLSIVSSILGSVLSGGATGLLGAGLQRFFDWLNVKANLQRDQMRYDHELAMRDKDAAIAVQEWAQRTKIAQTEGEAAKDVAATSAFSTTLLREPERYSNAGTLTTWQNWVMVILDFIRGVIRPGLTLYLCFLTSYIWLEVHNKLALEDLDTAQALQIWLLVVETILYLTTTVVLWWFGTRNQQSAPSAVSLRVAPQSSAR